MSHCLSINILWMPKLWKLKSYVVSYTFVFRIRSNRRVYRGKNLPLLYHVMQRAPGYLKKTVLSFYPGISFWTRDIQQHGFTPGSLPVLFPQFPGTGRLVPHIKRSFPDSPFCLIWFPFSPHTLEIRKFHCFHTFFRKYGICDDRKYIGLRAGIYHILHRRGTFVTCPFLGWSYPDYHRNPSQFSTNYCCIAQERIPGSVVFIARWIPGNRFCEIARCIKTGCLVQKMRYTWRGRSLWSNLNTLWHHLPFFRWWNPGAAAFPGVVAMTGFCGSWLLLLIETSTAAVTLMIGRCAEKSRLIPVPYPENREQTCKDLCFFLVNPSYYVPNRNSMPSRCSVWSDLWYSLREVPTGNPHIRVLYKDLVYFG